jgi:DNA-damage-inducible protein D
MSHGESGGEPEQADMNEIEVFHFKEGCKNFDDFGRDNSFRHWFASDLAKCLGYEDFGSFRKGALNRAMAACGSLGIPLEENIVAVKREVDGKEFADFKLSRFGCYLVAMNGDTRKPQVASAQAWFAAVAESFQQYLEEARDFERLAIRDEIADQERALGSVAKKAGVTVYAFMHDAGYRGMYNMSLAKLKTYKGKPDCKKPLLDYMGVRELAANQFRISETAARISGQNVRGQQACEQAAFGVGRDVRNMMQKNDSVKPEDLALEDDIADTRKNLKQAHKGFKKLDGRGGKGLPQPPSNGA